MDPRSCERSYVDEARQKERLHPAAVSVWVVASAATSRSRVPGRTVNDAGDTLSQMDTPSVPMKTRDSDPSFPMDLAVWFLPMAWALIITVAIDRGIPWVVAYAGAVLFVVVGAIKMFIAKLPIYRQGRFFTFGPQSLPESSLPLYWGAVKLIIVGVGVALLLLAPRFLFL